jgi:hypothetical protein
MNNKETDLDLDASSRKGLHNAAPIVYEKLAKLSLFETFRHCHG